MKNHKLLLTAGLILGGFTLQAQTALFDFGRHDGTNGNAVSNPSLPDGSTAVYWNSVGQAGFDQNGFTYSSFVDIDNNPVASWTIDTTASGTNLDSNGLLNGGLSAAASHTGAEDPTFANLGIFAEPDATGDYWFIGTGTAEFVMSGLNPALTYDFSFFGSRWGTGTRTTTYSITGLAGTSSVNLTTTGSGIGVGGYNGNNDTIASLAGISPLGDGSVTISLAIVEGGFAYLGAMEVTAVPEPGTYVLAFGILALGIVFLRRRLT